MNQCKVFNKKSPVPLTRNCHNLNPFDKNLSSTTISDGNFLKIFNKLKDNFKITRKMENDALKQFAIDFEKLLQESSDTFSRTITNFKSGTD